MCDSSAAFDRILATKIATIRSEVQSQLGGIDNDHFPAEAALRVHSEFIRDYVDDNTRCFHAER